MKSFRLALLLMSTLTAVTGCGTAETTSQVEGCLSNRTACRLACSHKMVSPILGAVDQKYQLMLACMKPCDAAYNVCTKSGK